MTTTAASRKSATKTDARTTLLMAIGAFRAIAYVGSIPHAQHATCAYTFEQVARGNASVFTFMLDTTQRNENEAEQALALVHACEAFERGEFLEAAQRANAVLDACQLIAGAGG